MTSADDEHWWLTGGQLGSNITHTARLYEETLLVNWLNRTGPECVKRGRNGKLCLVCSHFWSTHSVQRPHSTCAFLADVGQVVVAGHVVPLAILMGNGHHAVLASCEEVVRLALPPVLIHLQRQQNSANQRRVCFHLSETVRRGISNLL